MTERSTKGQETMKTEYRVAVLSAAIGMTAIMGRDAAAEVTIARGGEAAAAIVHNGQIGRAHV